MLSCQSTSQSRNGTAYAKQGVCSTLHMLFCVLSSMFAAPAPGEAWVLFLEKAFAQLFGNYKALEGSYPHIALHCLTGKPLPVGEEWLRRW